MKNTKNKKGFTLIELMVSIAIIGILTAIITTNFTSSKAKSRDAKRVSDLAQIQLALSLYFDRCNSYPPGIITSSKAQNCLATFGDFIQVIPTDSGTSYTYVHNTSLGVTTDYVLRATLETNSSALSDDIDDASRPAWAGGNVIACGATPDASPNLYYCVSPR